MKQAVYLPFWCFEFDVETICNHKNTTVTHYSSHSGSNLKEKEIALSLTELYGSYTFRRQFVQNVKTDLTASEPLRVSMLHNDVYMDIWGMPQENAWGIVKKITNDFVYINYNDQQVSKYKLLYQEKGKVLYDVECNFYNSKCRKVYLPAYIAEYRYLNNIFQVIINGSNGEAYGMKQYGIINSIIRRHKKGQNIIFSIIQSLFSPWISVKNQKKSFKEFFEMKECEEKNDFSKSVSDERVNSLFNKLFEEEQMKAKRQQEQQEQEEKQRRAYYSSTQFSPLATDYEVLGVDENCSFEDIQLAFRQGIHKWHPDVCSRSGIPEEIGKRQTQRIIEAYNHLRKIKQNVQNIELLIKYSNTTIFYS